MTLRTALAVLLLLTTGAYAAAEERTLDQLIDALSHPNPAVRMDAVDELGRRREALVPLLKSLRDVSPGVRAHAAEALRALGDERAVPFISRLLEDVDDTVRCRAVLAVGGLGGKYVLPSIRLRLSDPATVVRAAAVRALGEIGDPLSLDEVVAEASRERDDPTDAVAAAAVIAAAKIGGRIGLGRLFAIVKDRLPDSWFLRASFAHAVGLADDRERLDVLASWLEQDEDHRVCEAAAGAMGRMKAEELLKRALKSPDAFRRRAAIAGLDRLDGADVEKTLVAAVRDEDPGVVLQAASALLRRGRADAFPVVIGLLDRDAMLDAETLNTPVWLGALGVLEFRTGLPFGRNIARWKAWYKERGKNLELDPETGVYGVVR